MDSDFEVVLDLVGSYGKFQKQLLLYILNPISFYLGIINSLIFFQLIVPEYWCFVPGRDDSRFSLQEWKNMTIPKNNEGSFEKCLRYKTNFTEGTNDFYVANETQECVNGWDHDRSLFWETAATDKEWLCDKELYSAHVVAVSLAGSAVGALLLPFLADRYTGRKLMFFVAVGIHLVFNLALLIGHQLYFLHVAFVFLAGLSLQAGYQLPYIVTTEFLSPEHRTKSSFLSFVAWTFGMCASALMAYLVPHWWYLVLISCCLSFAILGFWRFLPESPRWLLSKGYMERCTQILVHVAEKNEKQNFDIDKLKERLQVLSETGKKSKVQLKQILEFQRFCRNGIVLSLLAIFTWITYGCVLINMDLLPNNHFLNFFILSFIELPSNFMGLASLNYLGRRMSSLQIYSAATVFCVLALEYRNNKILLLCLVAFVKLFATEGLYLIYTMGGEIFPTSIRSIGIGLVVVIATLTSMTCPYIIAVGDEFQYTVLIIINLACMLLGPLLPETLGLPLPQTLHDAEVLAQDRPFLKWIHYWNQNNKVTPQI